MDMVTCDKLDTEVEPSNLIPFEGHRCEHFYNEVLVRTHLWKNFFRLVGRDVRKDLNT